MYVGESGAQLWTRDPEDDTPNRVPAAVDFETVRGGVSTEISEFLAKTPYDGPRLVVDLSLVEAAYRGLSASLGGAPLFYAVKANPNPAILRRLNALGSNFDVASRGEIERCLTLGVDPSRMSFGHTVKRPADIAYAYANGVNGFAFDAEEELEKIARAAPGARVFCRLLVEDTPEGADWPLSRKFGCAPAMAERLLLRAIELGLTPYGLSFHVGSQMRDPSGWRKVLEIAASVWRRASLRGVRLETLNIGGGFPARYKDGAPPMAHYGARVLEQIAEAFNGHPPRIIAEPGRGLVGDAGAIEAEVLLVSRKSDEDPKRWVYLDIGKFGGLAETMDEAIRYQLITSRDGSAVGPCVLAGPTCDSVDVMYENEPVMLPLNLRAGDRILIPATGAYTTTYASVWFNGFDPLQEFVVGQ